MQSRHRVTHLQLQPLHRYLCCHHSPQDWKRVLGGSPHDPDQHLHVRHHRRIQSHHRRGHPHIMYQIPFKAGPHVGFPIRSASGRRRLRF
jgi:hypothetical protein